MTVTIVTFAKLDVKVSKFKTFSANVVRSVLLL
jgi:hypothetical protein